SWSRLRPAPAAPPRAAAGAAPPPPAASPRPATTAARWLGRSLPAPAPPRSARDDDGGVREYPSVPEPLDDVVPRRHEALGVLAGRLRVAHEGDRASRLPAAFELVAPDEELALPALEIARTRVARRRLEHRDAPLRVERERADVLVLDGRLEDDLRV